MKILLEFDGEDDIEKEKAKHAMIGPKSAAFIDSFLDYLSCVAIPYARHAKDKPTAEEIVDKIYEMYINKIHEYEVFDALNEDMKELAIDGVIDADFDEVG